MDIFEDQSVAESSYSTNVGDVLHSKGFVTTACKQTGLDVPTSLSLTEDQQRLCVGSKDKGITLGAVKQLILMDKNVEDDFSASERTPQQLTMVHTTWGRLKKLHLKFWDSDTYCEWVALLIKLCPQAQVVHMSPNNNDFTSPATTPVGSPIVPPLPILQRGSPMPYAKSPTMPTSPRAFGHRPGQHDMYTMPVSPHAKRCAASVTKSKKGPGCLLPCLAGADVLDRDPVEVGAGHPHVKLVDYKLKYDAGKQYDKKHRSFSEDGRESIPAMKS